MCGIAGIVDFHGPAPTLAPVVTMLERIRHRGPDDQGTADLGPVALGMCRLSILDPTPEGHQPMASPDGRCWIVHNGEIYNFLELRAELEALGYGFKTATDTEVILAAYAAWGTDCVRRFNGIWAFVLWDGQERRLMLSRDRFGVKPLFLAASGGRLAFASEIKALRALPWVSSEPEAGAVRDFLVDGVVDHSERTFFRSIRRLGSATSLVVTPSGVRTDHYWGPPALSEDAGVRPSPDDRRRVAEYRDLLIDSIALQLRSDVAIGSCLSGGLDSSSIVGIATALGDGRLASSRSSRRDRDAAPELAFFAEFHQPGIDERPFVDAVVRKSGVTLRTTSPSAADFASDFDAVMRAQDEPFGSTSIVAQYFVMQLAHQEGVKVLLDGQGADETVGGYPPYVAMRVAGALRHGDAPSRRAAARALWEQHVPMLTTAGHAILDGRLVPARLRRGRMPMSWLGPDALHAPSLYPDLDLPPGTVLARNLWRQIASTNLPALLRYEDRNSMAFGIEARVPFLDHRLVEAALLLPDRLKIRPGVQKIALRLATHDVVPELVSARRDKVAFAAPEALWLAAYTRRAPSPLAGPLSVEHGFVRAGAGDGTADRALAWRLLALERWLVSAERPWTRDPAG